VTQSLAAQHSAVVVPLDPQRVTGPNAQASAPSPISRPGGTRRDQIIAGYIQPDPGLLLDKKPLHASRSLIGIVRRNTHRVADHRNEERFPPPAEAALGLAIKNRAAQLADISPSGLMALGQLPEAIGDKVDVQFTGYPTLIGTVIWKRDDRFGVARDPGAIDLAAA
jgi:hypothetical protein